MPDAKPTRDVPPRLGDYQAERATYRIEVPERFNPVIDIVERWAADAIDSLRLDREWNLLFWEFACVAAREPQMGGRFAEQLSSFRSGGAEEMKRMIESAGISSAVPYARLARIIAALANGLALDLLLAADKSTHTEVRETIATAMALLWRGVASVSSEHRGGENDAG